jgi:hypothetical protein
MEIKMKNVSNIAAAAAVAVVLAAFALKVFGVTDIPMTEAIAVGVFMKGVFLPVDASIFAKNVRGAGGGVF